MNGSMFRTTGIISRMTWKIFQTAGVISRMVWEISRTTWEIFRNLGLNGKEDIKRLLVIYFEQNVTTEKFRDFFQGFSISHRNAQSPGHLFPLFYRK